MISEIISSPNIHSIMIITKQLKNLLTNSEFVSFSFGNHTDNVKKCMNAYHQDVLWDVAHHTLSSFMTPWENLLSCVSLLGIASPPSLQNLKGTMIHIVDCFSPCTGCRKTENPIFDSPLTNGVGPYEMHWGGGVLT